MTQVLQIKLPEPSHSPISKILDGQHLFPTHIFMDHRIIQDIIFPITIIFPPLHSKFSPCYNNVRDDNFIQNFPRYPSLDKKNQRNNNNKKTAPFNLYLTQNNVPKELIIGQIIFHI